MAGILYVDFHSITVEQDKKTEGTIRYHLQGFDKSKHSAKAELQNGCLVVTANKESDSYRSTISGLSELTSATVKLGTGKIDVYVKKASNINLKEKINSN